MNTKAQTIVNESPVTVGAYNFQVQPNVDVLKADKSVDPLKIEVTQHSTPTLMGYKTGADYNITHLHSSGAQTANHGEQWLDPEYGKAYQAKVITIGIRGKDNKQKRARVNNVNTSLTSHNSIATITTSMDSLTLTYALDGQALTEFNNLGTLLASTGDYKITCKLTDDPKYIKTFGD